MKMVGTAHPTALVVKPKEAYSSPVGWVEQSETQRLFNQQKNFPSDLTKPENFENGKIP